MKRVFLLLVLATAGISMSAQSNNSLFFLDHSSYSYRINPALQPDEDVKYVFGALVDNIGINVNSNVGVSTFLYPVDGKLVTGLHESVSSETFLNALPAQSNLRFGLDANVLTFGMKTAAGGFASLEINTRHKTAFSLPNSVFEYLKLGSANNEYDIRDLKIRTNNFTELALGYSCPIGDKLTLGGRIKLLGGIAYANLNTQQLRLKINTQDKNINVNGNGSLDIYGGLLKLDSSDGTYSLDNLEIGSPGFGGFGAALDLGVSYRPIEDLELSASVRDLGGILWKNRTNALMKSVSSVSINDDNLEDALSRAVQFEENKTAQSSFTSLSASVNLGARYRMPFYNRLSVGALGTFEFGGLLNVFDARLGLTVTPVDQISISANVGQTSFGPAFGLFCNFTLGPVQLFFGTDSMVLEFTPQMIPVGNFNMSSNFGLVFQIRQ